MRKLAGQVHCTEQVDKARVLRAGEDPPRALQLVDAAETLQPGTVEQLALARMTRAAFGDLDVAVQRIGDQVDLAEPAGRVHGDSLADSRVDGVLSGTLAGFAETAEVIAGDHALVQWTATTSAVRTVGGFDSFLLSDGKIVAQSGGCEIVPVD